MSLYTPARFFLVVFLTLGLPWAAHAQIEGVRREEVDAGVHIPVLTRAPELLEFVQAAYPADAQAQGLGGSVKLLVTISEVGAVTDATVTEPAGHGFDEAAVEAVKQFRFSPAEVDGVPAPVQIEYVYHFKLETPVDAGTPEPPPDAILKGQIIARGSRTRVPNATIRCGDAEDAREATSDAEGRFELLVQPGVCQVRVVADGYQRFETEEPLAEAELREVVYHLIPTAIGYETVVRAAREKKEVVRRTIQRQELQRVPGTFGDPVRVLQNLPGVARAPALSGQLIVRGASPDQTGMLLDGVEMPLLFHLGGGPSVVNAEFIDRIDFYPGGFGARYGRAVGGMVDVATRRGAADTWHGSVDVDFIDSGFFVEAPVTQGVSLAAAARRSYVDLLIPLVVPEDPAGGTLMVLPAYWDYQVRVDVGGVRDAVNGGPRNTFYVMAFGSDDTMRVVATGGARNRDVTVDVRTLFHRVKGDWTFRHGNITSVFAPYAGYDLAGADLGLAKFDLDVYTLGAREDLSLELFPALTVRTGFDLLFEHIDAFAELPVLDVQYVPFPGAEPKAEPQTFERVFNQFDGAGFLEADVKIGPVTVTPGLRGSYARIRGQNRQAWDPRLWVAVKALESTTIKGSVGLYTQPPAGVDMEAPPLGNPELVHEKAFQTAVGVDHRFTDVISLDVTGYYNRRYDNVVSPGRILQNEDGTITYEQYGNLGLGRAYGLEVMLRHDVTRNLFGWIAYTLNRSESRRARSGRPEYDDQPYRLTTYDQTHILTAVASYRLPLGFELGARFRYVTGRPLTPELDGPDLYEVDGNRYRGTYGETRSTRYRSFHQLDLRLDKTFLFENWALGIYLDVQNVYNAQNVETLIFDYRYRETIEVPGIPFLPVLGVKGSF